MMRILQDPRTFSACPKIIRSPRPPKHPGSLCYFSLHINKYAPRRASRAGRLDALNRGLIFGRALTLFALGLVGLMAAGCPASTAQPDGPASRVRVRPGGAGPQRRAGPRPIRDAMFAQGVRGLRRKPTPDFKGAREAFHKVLAKRPAHLAAQLNVAYCSLHLGQLRQARAEYTKAVSMNPKHRGARFGLVDVLLRSGKAARALTLLTTYLAQHPRDLTALGLAASAHLALGQSGKALARVQAALAIDRKDVLAHLNFARLYLAKGDTRTALMIFSRGLRLAPKSASLFFGRGQAFMITKEMGRAVMDFERAAKLAPNHTATRLNLGKVYVDNLDYKGALGHFRRVLQIWPRNRAGLLGKARALFGLRKFKAALAGYQVVIKRHGPLPVALYQVAKIYQDHLDKPRQALYYYKKFVGAAKGLSKKDPVFATIRMLKATSQPRPQRTPPRRRGARRQKP